MAWNTPLTFVKSDHKRVELERALQSLGDILQPFFDQPIDLLWGFPQSPMIGVDRPPRKLKKYFSTPTDMAGGSASSLVAWMKRTGMSIESFFSLGSTN